MMQTDRLADVSFTVRRLQALLACHVTPTSQPLHDVKQVPADAFHVTDEQTNIGHHRRIKPPLVLHAVGGNNCFMLCILLGPCQSTQLMTKIRCR